MKAVLHLLRLSDEYALFAEPVKSAQMNDRPPVLGYFCAADWHKITGLKLPPYTELTVPVEVTFAFQSKRRPARKKKAT